MGNAQEARRIIAEAETGLRQLIEQAMREQRYGDVAEVALLADALARVAVTKQRPAGSEPNRFSADSRADLAPRARRVSAKATARRKAAFPRFERDGETLIKIGWSKKNRTAYQHRAPKETVLAFLRHLTTSAKPDKPFAVEDLMPVPDFGNGGEVPAYRVYLALAWLRHVDAIQKTGRNGYVLNPSAATPAAIQGYWSALPQHKVSA